MTPMGIHRRTANVNGIDIFFLDTETEGPAILCLHGRWGRGETWIDFMRQYGEAYRVIAPDQRGHGLSGKPDSEYSTEEMGADMIALLDFLDIEKAIVVGHSMGGSIAGYLAARHGNRVKAVAILDKSAAGPAHQTAHSRTEDQVVDPVAGDWPMPFACRKDAQECVRNTVGPGLGYDYFMNSLVEEPSGYRMMFSPQAMVANIARYRDWFHLLPDIKCKTLLVRSGSHEAVADSDWEKMKSSIADCTAFEMSHPDHNVHLGDKTEFYRCFDSFLEKPAGS